MSIATVGKFVMLGLIVLVPGARASVDASGRATAEVVATLADGQWFPAGSLNTGRRGHTATRLLDGSVLVVGGYNAPGPGQSLDSAETYDPLEGAWRETAKLHLGRRNQTATLLLDGRVLVVGGYRGDSQTVCTSEVFDPATGTWADAGAMCRSGHAAALLSDGRVLVVGGHGKAGAEETAELYDPRTGAWSGTGDPGIPRVEGHVLTVQANGTVLVTGGRTRVPDGYGDYNDALARDVESYDPVLGTWSPVASLQQARKDHSAIRLGDGRVLLFGGTDTIIPANPIGSIEVFDPAGAPWQDAGDPRDVRGSPHGATSLRDGRVLLVADRANLLYDPESRETRTFNSFDPAPTGATSTLLANGSVLVTGGGFNFGNYPSWDGSAAASLFVPQAPFIDGRMTGVWYDPSQAGHGLMVEILPDHRVLAWWFAFNPEGTEQVWFGGSGTYSGNTATISLAQRSTGGRWIPNFDPTRVSSSRWGQLTLGFTDLDHGWAEFSATPGYGADSLALTRLTRPLGACDAGSGADPLGSAIDSRMTGVWYDPAQDGHGIFLEVLPDQRLLAWWFAYTPDGTQQAWFGGVGSYAGNTATVSHVIRTTGGGWITNFHPQHVRNEPWGSFHFTFDDADHGRVEFSSSAGFGSGSLQLTRLTRPVGTCAR